MSFAAHLERFWPDSVHEALTPARASAQERLPGFRVVRIAPARPGEPWLYATCGAAQAAPGGQDGAEYVLFAPAEDAVLVEMLAALATVNADSEPGLGVGSVIELGRPWTQRSPADHLLVLPPYAFPEGFDVAEDGERRIVVLWLVPITAAEARLAREEGHVALEQRIEDARVDVADPARDAVA